MDVVYLLNRFFSDDLSVDPSHKRVFSFDLNDHINVDLYTDSPCYMAIFSVDRVPVLKECFIDNEKDYRWLTRTNPYLAGFVEEYASPV